MTKVNRCEWAVGLLVLCVALRADAAPKVFVEKAAMDLGNLKEGEAARHTFVIENRGDQPLEIRSVKPAMLMPPTPGAAASAPADLLGSGPRTLAPGGKLEIPVELETKGKANRIGNRWAVTSNDPVEPILYLRLSATIAMLYTATPAALFFRSVRAGETIPNAISLLPTEKDAKLELIGLKSDVSGLEVITEALAQPNVGKTGVTVKVKVEPGVPLGLVRGVLTGKVKVGGEDRDIQIPVQGQVVGDVMLIPPWIAMTMPMKRDKSVGEVILRANEGVQVVVKQATSRSPFLQTEVVEQETDKHSRVKLKLADNAPGGPLATIVDIFTTSKDLPIASVPVFVNVEESVDMSPAWVYFGASGERATKRLVTLSVPNQSPLTIEAVQSDDPAIVTKILPDAQKKHVAQVEVALKDDAKPADHHALLRIKTNIAGAESLTIPVISVLEEGKRSSSQPATRPAMPAAPRQAGPLPPPVPRRAPAPARGK